MTNGMGERDSNGEDVLVAPFAVHTVMHYFYAVVERRYVEVPASVL